MKKMALTLLALAATTLAHARDDVVVLPLADVVQMGLDLGKLDGSVKFYLSGAATPRVSAQLGDDVSNKKTNGVGKDDAAACKWAALSALMAFEASAKQKDANAVVDLHSFYKRNPKKDPVNFECHAGNVVIGVALKGTYARVAK
ncbi:excinuclease ATPase subunit [Comamonas sp. UBA7528]|jgi:hypothetical protein|uniref:excinuclease ATPase subunit n=1 Tax=Comamonas sp. UBA7528 TaxID=1946391 RepID=UPI0025C3C1C2|nr:excinuclease ATPase subunit [Comamonas sp. UBA7528]